MGVAEVHQLHSLSELKALAYQSARSALGQRYDIRLDLVHARAPGSASIQARGFRIHLALFARASARIVIAAEIRRRPRAPERTSTRRHARMLASLPCKALELYG